MRAFSRCSSKTSLRRFVNSLEDLGSFGKSYDLCGPKVYTLRELVEFAGAATGHPRPVIGLNDMLSYLQAFAWSCCRSSS